MIGSVNLLAPSTRVKGVGRREEPIRHLDSPPTDSGAAVGMQPNAFDAFVLRRYPALVRFGYVLTGNRTSAEDLVQTALFSTYRRWERLDDQVDPAAYVRRAMVNAHISWTRLLSSREQLFADPPDSVGYEDEHGLERLHMWRHVLRLPARMRAVLVLRFYEDLTESETARVLGCSVGTVKSQTSRGLARLRSGLTESEGSATTTALTPVRRTAGEGQFRMNVYDDVATEMK